MKSHHTAFCVGVALLMAASIVNDRQVVGWWMISGLLFLALSFALFMTRR